MISFNIFIFFFFFFFQEIVSPVDILLWIWFYLIVTSTVGAFARDGIKRKPLFIPRLSYV